MKTSINISNNVDLIFNAYKWQGAYKLQGAENL